MKNRKPFRFSDLAEQVANGIRTGNLSIKGVGMSSTVVQLIYRRMRADGYKKGDMNMTLYICKKICDEVLININRDMIQFVERFSASLLDDEESFRKLVDKYVTERNRDVLFCAMIGATMQSTDSVGMKSLKIVNHLYQSS